MASGIAWKYRIENLSGAPVRYDVGMAWATGEPDALVVGTVQAYRQSALLLMGLPGLGGAREHWRSAEYGYEFVAVRAAKNTMSHSAAEWLKWVAWPGDHAAFLKAAKVDAHDDFSKVWSRIAEAAETYPKQFSVEARWEVSRLSWGEKTPATPEQVQSVLSALDQWQKLDLRKAICEHDRAISL